MARAGDVLEHPVTGERVVWLRVARDTDGRLLEGDIFARPGGHPAATHVHPHQEERFRVVQGTVRFEVDGGKRVLGAGETTTVPPGRAHTWANVGDDEACVRVEIEPALRTEMFFETFFGLAKDGRTNSKGLPNLLSMAVILREYDAEMQLARPPPPSSEPSSLPSRCSAGRWDTEGGTRSTRPRRCRDLGDRSARAASQANRNATRSPRS
ncbi:cupin domain-containing protein [Nocardioides sp. GCM10028917]|uniref:cupin domain-containing protein n=1 Tax=Nocardioides sp. GCM10028917 TaxID=3273408 RepID=UPI003608B54B